MVTIQRESMLSAVSSNGSSMHKMTVDVPVELIDCLANDMPRLLQLFRHWDRGKTGEVSLKDFERAMYALGIRYRLDQTRRLFSLLDADGNNRVSLEELLMLKFAIDNHVTSLPARPGLVMADDDGNLPDEDEPFDAQIELRIEDVDEVDTRSGLGLQCLTGVFSCAAPMLGLVWKSQSRPHHALALDNHLEHTRGPPAVHAPMRVCRRPELGPGFHVKLLLVPLRDELQGERVRYVYEAGGSSEADKFCDSMYAEIEQAAERAVGELQGLLGECRQIDLKLEEVRLMQRGEKGDIARRKLMRLKKMLIALASDAEESCVAHTRYTRTDFTPKHLTGNRKIVRFKEELMASDWTRFRIRNVARLSGVVLFLAALTQLAVHSAVWDNGFGLNHEACEFHQYACRTRPWQYTCNRTDGTIQLLATAAGHGGPEYTPPPPPPPPSPPPPPLAPSPCSPPPATPPPFLFTTTTTNNNNVSSTCADVVAPYAWGASLLDRACDPTIQQQSSWFLLPLPFLLFATVILPLGLFYGNAHVITVQKTLIWTPLVPLILLQCVFRTAVLASIVHTAADTTYAVTEALVSVVLTLQVAVFLLMDAMRYPTPLLRIGFSLALLYRFGASVVQRATLELAAEQDPLLDPTHWLRTTFEGVGASRKQSIVSSVDWTISAMLFSTIISVINFPGEMAVVRLRCDTRRYFNFRDQYLSAMRIRAHRRDLDAADAALWMKAKFPVWLDRQKQRMQQGVQRAKTTLFDLSPARRNRPQNWLDEENRGMPRLGGPAFSGRAIAESQRSGLGESYSSDL